MNERTDEGLCTLGLHYITNKKIHRISWTVPLPFFTSSATRSTSYCVARGPSLAMVSKPTGRIGTDPISLPGFDSFASLLSVA